MNETKQLARKLEVAARKAWLRDMSDAGDLARAIDLTDIPRYFTQLCALASLGEMPGVEQLYKRISSTLAEIALIPALAELSLDDSLSPNEKFVLARATAFLFKAKARLV